MFNGRVHKTNLQIDPATCKLRQNMAVPGVDDTTTLDWKSIVAKVESEGQM